MALKPVVESLDDVPEPLREYYVERDGRFVIDAEEDDLESLLEPRISPLKTALERQKEEARKAKDRLKALEDVDPEEYRRLRQEEERRKTRKKTRKKGDDDDDDGFDEEIEAEIERRTKEAIRAHERKMEEKDTEIQELTGNLDSLVVENAIQKAAIGVGVREKSIPAAVALAKQFVKRDGTRPVVMEEAGSDNVAYGKGGEPKTVEELLEEIARDYDLFKGSTGTGADHQDGSTRMPRKKASEMSRAEKAAFIREHGIEAWEEKIANE